MFTTKIAALFCPLFVIAGAFSAQAADSIDAKENPTPLFKISEAECPEQKLNDQFGPVRDQEGTDFCYAFAAADLLSQKLKGDAVSAYDLLTNYISMSSQDYLNARARAQSFKHQAVDVSGHPLTQRGSGRAEIMIGKVINDGSVCTEKEIPSQGVVTANNPDAPNDINNFINQHILSDAGLVMENPGFSPVNDSFATEMRKNVLLRCIKKVSTKDLKMKYMPLYSKSQVPELKKTMQELLIARTPYLISFNACLLFPCSPGYTRPHGSLVVGQRWNKDRQQCQLQIRSTYGKSCAVKNASVDCENDTYFADFEQVVRHLMNIVYLL